MKQTQGKRKIKRCLDFTKRRKFEERENGKGESEQRGGNNWKYLNSLKISMVRLYVQFCKKVDYIRFGVVNKLCHGLGGGGSRIL